MENRHGIRKKNCQKKLTHKFKVKNENVVKHVKKIKHQINKYLKKIFKIVKGVNDNLKKTVIKT